MDRPVLKRNLDKACMNPDSVGRRIRLALTPGAGLEYCREMTGALVELELMPG